MPSPSSIFSFDTLQVHWGVPRGLLTAVVLLGVLDFGLSRADWPYRKYPSSYVGTFLSQEEVLRRDPVPPRIIILGNSRSKCGLLSQEIERLLGLPDGAVLNLSIESGDHYDNYMFQKRNRQQMKSARLLIYAVDAYEWNTNFPLSERFPHFAGLSDRLYLEPSVPSLFGWFFRTEEKAALYHAIFRRIKGRLVGASRLASQASMTLPPINRSRQRPIVQSKAGFRSGTKISDCHRSGRHCCSRSSPPRARTNSRSLSYNCHSVTNTCRRCFALTLRSTTRTSNLFAAWTAFTSIYLKQLQLVGWSPRISRIGTTWTPTGPENSRECGAIGWRRTKRIRWPHSVPAPGNGPYLSCCT